MAKNYRVAVIAGDGIGREVVPEGIAVLEAAARSYGTAVWNDVRDGADCPAIDEFRQDLHDEAVETGGPTTEPEEPRGEEDRRNAEPEQEEPAAPDIEAACPANFGNSDIFGWTSAP